MPSQNVASQQPSVPTPQFQQLLPVAPQQQSPLSNNIKKSYDKLTFMEVFRIDFDKCTTMANAINGFKKVMSSIGIQ